MTAEEFLQRLLDYERRVGTLYFALGNRSGFPGDLRAFWHRMAEDERHHAVVLLRSRSLIDLQDAVPADSEDIFQTIEQLLIAAEISIHQPDVSIDEALRLAILLEGSELNRLSDTWLHCFPPALQTLLSALTPEDNVHLSRVVEAVHAHSSNKALHEQATLLWMKHQRTKAASVSK